MADTDLFAKFDDATLEYLKAKWADRNLPDMHPQSHGHLKTASRCIFILFYFLLTPCPLLRCVFPMCVR